MSHRPQLGDRGARPDLHPHRAILNGHQGIKAPTRGVLPGGGGPEGEGHHDPEGRSQASQRTGHSRTTIPAPKRHAEKSKPLPTPKA